MSSVTLRSPVVGEWGDGGGGGGVWSVCGIGVGGNLSNGCK